MNERKKIIKKIFLATLLVLCVIGLLVLNKKQEEEHRIRMEQKEQERQKKLHEEVLRTVRSYVYEIEVALREEGLLDADVVSTECTREEYEELFQKMPSVYCDYYFKVEYFSDNIATLCDEVVNDEEITKKWDFMKLLAKWSDVNEFHSLNEEPTVQEYKIEGETVNVCINDGIPYKQMLFKTSDGQEYEIKIDDDVEVYRNKEQIIQGINPNRFSSSKKNHSSNSSSQDREIYNSDPYDVEEYNNADDFADEWADEFADSYNGDYEDGYDDASDYWENGY